MRKIKLFLSLLMVMLLSVGNVWATDPVTLAAWTFSSTSYPANKTNFAATSGTCTGSTFYLDGTGSTWNTGAGKGYAFTAVTSVTITLKLSEALPEGTQITFAADIFYNKASNAPMKGFDMSVSVNGGSFGTTGLTPTSISLTNSSANKSITYTTQSALAKNATIALKYTQTGKAGAGQGFFNNITIVYTPSGSSNPTVCEAPTFLPAAGAVLAGTEVTLSCATDGATIHYTTDGSVPTASSPTYSSAITIDAAKTIKAIAVKTGLTNSAVATAAYTLVEPLATMQDIFNAATSTATDKYITFSNTWVVTGVSTNGQTAYITDGTNGMILFNNSASAQSPVGGLAVGNTLSGTKQCSLMLYGGAAEIKNFTADGLTKGNGNLPNVQTLDAEGISNLSAVNTGSLIKISGQCTSANSKYYIAGVQLYNSLFAFSNPTVNANYECTGVYVRYNSTNEICPRSAADLVVKTAKSQANTYWDGAASASLTVRANESVTAQWSTESTGAKHFASSAEGVATIAADGAITIKGEGTTVLTYTTDENNDYYSGTATLTLTVKAALPAGATEFTWVAYDWAVANNITANTTLPASIDANSYITMSWYQNENQNAPGYNANNKDARLYRYNSVKFDSKNGKLFAGITLNFRTSSVKGSNMAANCGTYDADKGEWSGLSNSVTITNTGTENVQANILSIEFVYIDGTVTTLSIANVALKTTDDPFTIVPTCNVDPIPSITYNGYNENVVTIAEGKITPVGVGSTTVTARIAQGSNYTAAETTFTITVSEKQLPALSFAEDSYNANLGADFSEPELVNTNSVSPIIYSSSVETVATVDENSGAITLVGEGETVITAYFDGNKDYSSNSTQYTLNVIDPNKDVLTAAGIGKTSYEDWSKSFTTAIVYAGNSTTNAGRIQMRNSDNSGIVTTSTIGYLKSISAAAASENAVGHKLQIYAKNTAYGSAADLYDAEKRGTLIGTIAEAGGNMIFEEGKGYADNYKYIGIKSASGAVYYDDITIAWTPVEFTTYSVTYQAGEGATGEEVVVDGIEEGTTIQLATKPEGFTYADHAFAGWKLDNAGETLAAGDDYDVTGNATFVAQWSEAYTITYKAGDGEGDDVEVSNLPSGLYHLAANTFTAPQGKVFIGWKLEDVEEDVRAAGSEYTIAGSVAFVAQWLTANVVTFIAGTDKSDGNSITKEGITITATTFNGETYYQCYSGQSMTIAAGLGVGTILKIELTCTAEGSAKYGPGQWTLDGYSYDGNVGTWNGSSTSVAFGNASQQARMTQVVVYYIPDTRAASGLAWSTDEVEITLGDDFTAANLVNPNGIDAAEISIESSNTDLAVLNNGAVELVPDATGTATITATFAGNATYKPAEFSYTIKVNDPTPMIITNPTTYLNFGSVEQGATINAKTLQVTLQNVAAATVAITGDGKAAFSVDETALTGNITLNVSASSANVGTFAATLTISDEAGVAADKEISLSLTITEPETPETAVSTTSMWVAATAADLVDGAEVLITGATGGVTYAIGVQNDNNRAAVAGTLSEGVFTPGENTMSFTLVAQETEGVFALQASNGEYLYAASSTKNYLKRQATLDDNAKWTLTATSAVANGSNTHNDLKFNATNSPKIFSCYTGGQTAIQLYVPKPVTPPAQTYNRDNLTPGNYATICLPNSGTIDGAKLFDIEYYDGVSTTLYLLEVNGSAIEAGRPYIFLPSASSITVTYTGNEGADAGSFNGLVGSYTQQNVNEIAGENYILYQNAYYLVNSTAYVGANRAYIHMDGVPTEPSTPQVGQAPRRRVAMSVHGEQVATGIDALNASDAPVKVLINGQLFIIRGEKMFDAKGQLVK